MIQVPYEVGLLMLDLSDTVEHFYLFTFEKTDVICKPLTMGEVEIVAKFAGNLPDYIIYDWVCSKTIIYCDKGNDWLLTEASAGHAEELGKKLIEISTIDSQDSFLKKLNSIRETKADSLYSSLESVICTAYKQITPKDIRRMYLDQYLTYIVQSENILQTKLFPENSKGLPVQEGYTSIGQATKDWLLSKEAADIPKFDEQIP